MLSYMDGLTGGNLKAGDGREEGRGFCCDRHGFEAPRSGPAKIIDSSTRWRIAHINEDERKLATKIRGHYKGVFGYSLRQAIVFSRETLIVSRRQEKTNYENR